jgi:hypothetical protein
VSSLRNARLKPHKAPRAQSVLTPRQTSPAVASCSQRSSQHASTSNPSRPTKRAHSHGRLRRAACLHVSRCHISPCLLLSHHPRTWLKKGTKCGRASVRTHFQLLSDSSRRAFCAPSHCRWHADPPAGCTDTLMLKNERSLAQIGTRLVFYSPLPTLKSAWNMRSKLALFLRITGLLGHWLRIFLNSTYEQKVALSILRPFHSVAQQVRLSCPSLLDGLRV